MEKRIVIVLMVAFCSFINAKAQYTVIDPECIGQVGENTAKATAGELAYKEQLKKIKDKHGKNEKYAAAIATAKTLYEAALQNSRNFGEESLIYKRMLTKAMGIVTKTPQVLKYLAKEPKRSVLGYTRMAKIEMQTKGLVSEMCSIVSGGRMPNPFGKDANTQDGHNMLNTYDRMTAANIILDKLSKINFSLDVLLFRFKYDNTWASIIREIDPLSIFYASDGKIVSNEIINGFKKW